MASWIGLAVFFAAAGLPVYAFIVEPYWIEVTQHSIAGDVSQPLKIVHLSDLHTHGYGRREESVAALVERAAPDIIVVTGDTVDEGSLEPSRELFRHLRAPLGIWVVRGHGERFKPVGDEAAFYRSVGAHFLDNQGARVRDDVWVMGLDDVMTGHPDVNAALAGAPASAFKIALFHAPDLFSEIAGLFHLGLAGHSHGGQIRLPGVGPLWLPKGAEHYIAGWYTENHSKLYVSRGIGTTRVPARLFSRPEIAVIEIRPN